ncbi:MAG: phosphohistidine phosphatase SixA [Bdellovibrionota bacterium]
MNLILVRHAVAEDREEFAKKNLEDSSRPLTVKGRKKMVKMLDWISPLLGEIDMIVSSPYVRAMQTSEILQGIWSKIKIDQAAELVPHSPPQSFMKWLKAHAKDKKNVIAVGHEPHLSLFLSYLLSSKNESFVEIKKSGMAAVEIGSLAEIETTHSQLLWLVQPKFICD